MSSLVMAGSRPLSLTHPSSTGTAAWLMLPNMRPARAGLVCTCPAMAGFRAATPDMLMVRGPVVYTPVTSSTLPLPEARARNWSCLECHHDIPTFELLAETCSFQSMLTRHSHAQHSCARREQRTPNTARRHKGSLCIAFRGSSPGAFAGSIEGKTGSSIR